MTREIKDQGDVIMLKTFEVSGLNQRISYKISFNQDINIFTGRNGAGKTTLLKLMWYMMSGNFDCAMEEIEFEYAKLTGDDYFIEINSDIKNDEGENVTQIYIKNKTVDSKMQIPSSYWNRSSRIRRAENMKLFDSEISKVSDKSVFFPTFRRIEGGFSMGMYTYRGERFEEAIGSIAERLSSNNHKFITSVSTRDIVDLLTRHYANVSELTNKLHIDLSNSIEKKINAFSSNNSISRLNNEDTDKTLLEGAHKILNEIQQELNINTSQREKLLLPFNILSDLINNIFHHKGIKVTEKLTLGEAKEAMFSDKLSAGEKQMLSFICYNAFSQDSVFFIDEPEISLHVDWQRTLFPTLISQSSNNQFFVATHSPFIYSKYEDKEIILNEDRGGF
jgi:predicted ATPase